MKSQLRLVFGSIGILGFALFPSRVSAQDTVDFEKQILPIFKASCFKCHEKEHTDETGKLKKPKGGLVMNTPEGIKKGGKEDGDKVVIRRQERREHPGEVDRPA